jgi:hypothetical protein
MAYATSLIPMKEHEEFALEFAKELLKEDFHESVNDYALDLSTNGSWDTFDICVFSNGEVLLKRGSDLLHSIWIKEDPKIEKAILTDVIIGKWPFHLEKYEKFKKFVNVETS